MGFLKEVTSMYRNTHATAGQNPGHSVVRRQRAERAGASSPPTYRTFARGRSRTSEFMTPSSRLGISLTEVLIAMGILTVGLLGVAAIFPVGSFYMQKGDVADRSSAIAQAAFNEAISRGVLNPENWLAWEDGIVRPNPDPLSPNVPLLPGSAGSTFTRPFAESLRLQKAAQASSNVSAAINAKATALEFGSVFMIDPLAISSVAIVNPANGVSGTSNIMRPGGVFPASTVWTIGPNGGLPPYPNAKAWTPWGDTWSYGPRWPIRRMTLRQPSATATLNKPLEPTLANKLFASPDDLALDLPTAQDKPSIQRMDVANVDLNGDGNSKNDPLARQSRGDYSWIATVSPTTTEARDALATDPSAFSYEVSIVVFFKRLLATVSPTDANSLTPNLDMLIANERGVQAKIVSTGLNGGEVLLTRLVPGAAREPIESPYANLKAGQWVFLCGPHPNSTNERPMMTARWYRVLSIEGKDRRLNSEGEYDPPPPATEQERRLVSLRGPQWPWQPATTAAGALDLNNTANISNALYVCIPAGAVAVHSKTIHLEGNSAWSGGAEGISIPPPPGPHWSP